MKRVLPIIVVMLFFAGIFIVPAGVNLTPARLQETSLENIILEQDAELSWLPADKTVRVAVYNEPNTTLPSYASTGTCTNNYANVVSLLEGMGYEVSSLIADDIINHELMTASYDVFVIADSLPRDNISEYIKDFWEGGGGILSFNTAFAYLHYFGMIDFSYAGSDGYITRWVYHSWSNHIIKARHSSAMDYHVDDVITEDVVDEVIFDINGIGVTVGNDFVPLAVTQPSDITGVAFAIDNNERASGRIVHLPGNCSTIPTWQHSIIEDSMDWLCPRPKARVAFDLSHYPYYGVDAGDYAGFAGDAYADYRDLLVARTYTFDKLWPSSEGNLTAERLAPYDMLMINSPEIPFTTVEITAVEDWIAAGGGLIAATEQTWSPETENINLLLADFDMELNTTAGIYVDITIPPGTTHPMTEDVSSVYFTGGCYVNISGNAEAVVINGPDIILGAQDYGNGRVVLYGDGHHQGSVISSADNEQFGINMVNWLTSGNAKILAFIDSSTIDEDPNDKPYRGPVAQALNELGVSWYYSGDDDYFNMSLHLYNWDLVIIEQFSTNMNFFWGDLLDYIKSGERLIIQSTQLNQMVSDAKPFRDYIGFAYAGNAIFPSLPIYFWDGSDQILTNPWDYVASNISTNSDYGFNSCWNLTVYSNATALGGMSETKPGSGVNSTIILGAGNNVLVNSMTLTAFTNDTDDSTYADNFEIWENQIAFMMRPEIDSPSDMIIEAGSIGESIIWSPTSDRPFSYAIVRDSFEIVNTVWDGGSITLDLEEDDLGIVSFHITVYDTAGSSATDTVVVTKEDTTEPGIDNPVDVEYEVGTTGHSITWICSDLFPDHYELIIDDVVQAPLVWDGSPVVIDVDELTVGLYNHTLVLFDDGDNSVSDTVLVAVVDTTAPTFIDAPDNLQYEEGTVTHLVNWSFNDLLPDSYVLYIDDIAEHSGTWDGSEISINVGGLGVGGHNLTIAVNDTSGNIATSEVYLTVSETITTTTTTTDTTTDTDTTSDTTTDTDTDTTTGTDPDLLPGDHTVLIIIIASVAGVVIIIIIIMMKKKS